MALIELPKKQFENEIGKLDEKMRDRIAMFGTPIDGETNENINVEVFPNRPDLISYSGFKRAFLAFLDKKTGLKQYKINKPEKDFLVTIDSSVRDVRPFTSCAIVKDLKLDEEKIKEIIDLQEKLHLTLGRKRKKLAIGIYPLEKIKLPITFLAKEPDKIKFQPLEYDKEMKQGRINPKDIKEKLAFEIVKTFHSEKEANKANGEFNAVFSKNELPEEIEMEEMEDNDE